MERISTWWMNRLAIRTRSGNGVRAYTVSHGSISHMAVSVPTKASEVPDIITVPKPASWRMAETSLDARDMRSPTRCAW